MKNKAYVKSFALLKEKNKKKIYAVAAIITVSLLLLTICTGIIVLNVRNVENNLMDNNGLMLIQVFGYSHEKDTNIIEIEKAYDIEHIVFATESVPIIIELIDDNGDFLENESLIVHRIDAKYSEYFGIKEMKENVIYSPSNGIKEVSKYRMQEPYDKLCIELSNYNGVAPAVLSGEDFASIATYERLKEAFLLPDSYFSTPEYFIGVDSTENVYSVVKELNEMYPDYKLKMYYQAEGLEQLVINSKKALYAEIIFLVILIMGSCITIQGISSSMISSLTKEMMIMHINGASRKVISNNFFAFVFSSIKPYLICSFLISFVSLLVLEVGKSNIVMTLIYLLISFSVAFVVLLGCGAWLKKMIYKKVCKSTSNDNISKMLRN